MHIIDVSDAHRLVKRVGHSEYLLWKKLKERQSDHEKPRSVYVKSSSKRASGSLESGVCGFLRSGFDC